MWISRNTFSRSVRDSVEEGPRGTCTFVLTDKGFVTCSERYNSAGPQIRLLTANL